MSITITELSAVESAAWDAYVEQAAQGLPHHLAGWQEILRKTNGYETRFLMARRESRLVGVMPLFVVRSLLVGHTAMTMPGGLCADDEAAAAALIAHGQEMARQAGVKRFVLQDTRRAWPAAKLQTSSHHLHWLLQLENEAEALWQRLDSNIRRQVRIARRNGLSVTLDRTGQQLGPFYDVFSRFSHQLGTPLFGRDFLEQVVETFAGRFSLAVVYQAQTPLGGYFQLELGQTMHGLWGASLREYLGLRPAYLAHWEIMQDACRRGYCCLDMGRSPAASNAARYKAQWGGLARPVYQQVITFGAAQNSESIASRVQADRKFGWLRRVWPRLPLPLVQYLGPKLRRHVPFA